MPDSEPQTTSSMRARSAGVSASTNGRAAFTAKVTGSSQGSATDFRWSIRLSNRRRSSWRASKRDRMSRTVAPP